MKAKRRKNREELRTINASRRDLVEAGGEVRSGPISYKTDVSSSNHILTSASHKVGVKGWRVG